MIALLHVFAVNPGYGPRFARKALTIIVENVEFGYCGPVVGVMAVERLKAYVARLYGLTELLFLPSVAGFVDTECAAVRAPGQASGGIGAEIADGTVFHRIVEVRGIFKIIHLPVRVRRCGGRACLYIYRRRISVRSHAGRLQ